MNMHLVQKPAAADLRPQIIKIPTVVQPSWKPQPGGLTREELRKIVLEALG